MNNSTEGYLNVTPAVSFRSFWAAVRLTPEFQALPVIFKVWTPCLLLLGGFGNVATIFVLCRIRDHNSSQHVFLIALAVTDLFILYVTVLFDFLNHYFRVRFWLLHTVTCKLHMWLYNVNFQLSAWLVTAVTVQRTLAIRWPHRIRVICTVQRTWTVVAALVLTNCVLFSDNLIMKRMHRRRCIEYITESYDFYLEHIKTWLSLTLGSFLPFVCLLVCNVLLSLSLFQATSASSVVSQVTSNSSSAQSNNSRLETARRTAVMVLVLSISFLLLTLPSRIAIVWHNMSISQVYATPKSYVTMWLTMHVTNLLVYTNSAINFFLYCFTGTKFRRAFLSRICCSAQGHSSRSVEKKVSG